MTDREFVLSHFPGAVHVRCAAGFGLKVWQRIRVCWSPRRYLCKCTNPENVWRAARQKIEARAGQPGYEKAGWITVVPPSYTEPLTGDCDGRGTGADGEGSDRGAGR